MFLHLLAWLFRVPAPKRRPTTNDPGPGWLVLFVLLLLLTSSCNGLF
jgi:hypothetical protein